MNICELLENSSHSHSNEQQHQQHHSATKQTLTLNILNEATSQSPTAPRVADDVSSEVIFAQMHDVDPTHVLLTASGEQQSETEMALDTAGSNLTTTMFFSSSDLNRDSTVATSDDDNNASHDQQDLEKYNSTFECFVAHYLHDLIMCCLTY